MFEFTCISILFSAVCLLYVSVFTAEYMFKASIKMCFMLNVVEEFHQGQLVNATLRSNLNSMQSNFKAGAVVFRLCKMLQFNDIVHQAWIIEMTL